MYNVLDFCVDFSREMVICGSNLERVQVELDRISTAYGLTDVSLFLQNNFVSMGARLPGGEYVSRQAAIPPQDIHLKRLRGLNRLYYKVREETPDPKDLQSMLEQALEDRAGYPGWLLRTAQILALVCVCMMFGGGANEVISVAVTIAVLQQVNRLLATPAIDHVVANALLMMTASFIAYQSATDFGLDIPVVLITVCIMLIPGISLVNAARNILCGNEMNGTMQFMKAVIETLAMAFGIFVILFLFDVGLDAKETLVTGPSSPAFLIILSFLVSFFNGICFHMEPRDLWLAGMGGALSRIALTWLTAYIRNPMIYSLAAASIAAVFGEILAARHRDPSTYFIYPAILPMIPGGSFYYSMIGLYAGNREMCIQNGVECALALAGMSIGFVLSSFIMHYARKARTVHIEVDKPL